MGVNARDLGLEREMANAPVTLDIAEKIALSVHKDISTRMKMEKRSFALNVMYHVTGHALVLVLNRVLRVKKDMRWIQKLDARMLMNVLRGSRYTNVMRIHSFVLTPKAAIDV